MVLKKYFYCEDIKMADLEKAELELETLLKAQGFKIKDVG